MIHFCHPLVADVVVRAMSHWAGAGPASVWAAASPGDSVRAVAACEECDYGYDSLTRQQIVDALPGLAEQTRSILTSVPAPALRAHVRPASRSALGTAVMSATCCASSASGCC